MRRETVHSGKGMTPEERVVFLEGKLDATKPGKFAKGTGATVENQVLAKGTSPQTKIESLGLPTDFEDDEFFDDGADVTQVAAVPREFTDSVGDFDKSTKKFTGTAADNQVIVLKDQDLQDLDFSEVTTADIAKIGSKKLTGEEMQDMVLSKKPVQLDTIKLGAKDIEALSPEELESFGVKNAKKLTAEQIATINAQNVQKTARAEIAAARAVINGTDTQASYPELVDSGAETEIFKRVEVATMHYVSAYRKLKPELNAVDSSVVAQTPPPRPLLFKRAQIKELSNLYLVKNQAEKDLAAEGLMRKSLE